jgi:hypothetical protein
MLEFAVVSFLKHFGYTEDGESFVGEVYQVLAEDSNGNRWAHYHTFPGVLVLTHPEEGFNIFEDRRKPAKSAADALLAKIVASGLDTVEGRAKWVAAEPRYGSKAFQEYGDIYDAIF